eukprot:UN32105
MLEDETTKLQEDYDELEATCNATERDLAELQVDCSYGVQCARCEVIAYNGALDSTITSISGGVTDLEELTAQYGMGIVYRNGQVYVQLDKDNFRETCVGYDEVANKWCRDVIGLNVVCPGGDKFGTYEQM